MAVNGTVEIGTLLYRREGFRAGRPCLAGTGMPVHTIAALHLQGLNAEEILAEFPHLDLPRIYAALTYFLANHDLVIAELDEDRQEADRLSVAFDSPRPS